MNDSPPPQGNDWSESLTGRKRTLILIAIAMAVASILCLLFIGRRSLWLDESVSVYFSHSWGSMWDILLHLETNMWLYYVLLNLWQIFGSSELVVRSLSVVFAVAAIPMVWALGRRLCGEKQGVVAAFLFAINVFVIQYAQQARGYALLLFLVTVSTYLFVKAVEQPSFARWVWCGAVSALAVYTHLFAVLALGAQGLSLIFLGLRTLPWKRMLAGAVAFALVLVPMFLFQSLNTGQADWIETPSLIDLFDAIRSLAGRSLILLVFYAPLTVISLVAWFKVAVRGDSPIGRWKYALLVLLLVAPVGTAFLFSVALKPMFIPRYLIFGVAPFVILAADGWLRLRRKGLQVLLAILLLGTTTRSLLAYYGDPGREDWRSVATLIGNRGSRGDAVIFYAYFLKIPFDYYFEQDDVGNPVVDRIDIASAPWRGHHGSLSDLPDPDTVQLSHLADHYHRIWLVLGYDHSSKLGRDAESARIQSALAEKFTLAGSFDFQDIRVSMYENRALDNSPAPSHR